MRGKNLSAFLGPGVLKVLVVDDSLAVQRSLGGLLTAVAGVAVTGYASDVAQALESIAHVRPDVIVLDVDLRGGDRGMNILRQVVGTHPQIQVIVLSNFTWDSMRTGFLSAGAKAYFDKSTEFMKARDWVAKLAQSRSSGPTEH